MPLANRVKHPRNVYIREAAIVPRLDRWLGRLFSPANIDRTIDALVAAEGQVNMEDPAVIAARRQLAECDRKLAQHRAALEAGADPVLVTAWMREVQTRKAKAEEQLRGVRPGRRRVVDRDALAEALERAGDVVDLLGDADPVRKAKIYASLGLRLTYHPEKQKCPGQTSVVPGPHGRTVGVRGRT